MRSTIGALASIGCGALLCLRLGSSLAQPPGTPLPEGIRGGSELVPEPHVEIRSYRFAETGEELPYSLFVSSKIHPGKKAPLIIALRGYTGTTLTFVRGTTVDLAEEGGYILAGPIGYNNRAGFGVQARPRVPPNARRRRSRTARARPTAAGRRNGGNRPRARHRVQRKGRHERARESTSGARRRRPAHLFDGSFPRRQRRASPGREIFRIWAAVALLAPAPFGAEPNADSKILNVPLLITVGDKDSLLPSAKMFSEQLNALHAKVEYREFAGLDHGTIILGSQPAVFAFFAKHVKDRSSRR